MFYEMRRSCVGFNGKPDELAILTFGEEKQAGVVIKGVNFENCSIIKSVKTFLSSMNGK